MRFLFLLLLAVSPMVSAEFYWTAKSTSTPTYTSAEQACKTLPVGYPYKRFVLLGNDPVSQRANCYYAKPDGSEWFDPGTLYVTRHGTCPAGTVYNAYTGACDGDPCLPTVGQVIYHGHFFRNLDADGNPDSDPPVAVCKDACQYTHTLESFSSKRKGDQLEGSFKYKGNGVSCTVSSSNPSNFDQPPSKPPMSPQQEYFSEKSCDNWVTNADGTSSRSCVSSNRFNEPGKLNCQYGSGVMVCNVGTPSPNSKDTNVTEQTDVALNSDGSKNTTTNTSTTTTTCKGMSKCTTSTKDETKTEGTNPDGTPGDTSSECKGSGCDPEKEGEDGEEEEEQEEEGIPGPSRSLAQGEQGSFDDAHAHWDQEIEEASNTLQTKVDQYANQFSGVFDLNLGGSGGSLPCEQVPITIGSTTQNLDMCLDRFSEPLGYLRFAILLAATALAALIILR